MELYCNNVILLAFYLGILLCGKFTLRYILFRFATQNTPYFAEASSDMQGEREWGLFNFLLIFPTTVRPACPTKPRRSRECFCPQKCIEGCLSFRFIFRYILLCFKNKILF